MAFVLKKFNEADQPKYDALHLKNRLSTFRYPMHWEVDEDRDAVFVVFGGRGHSRPEYGEPPNFHALVWRGHTIELEGFYHSTFPEKNREVIWYRMELFVPHSLESEVATIKEMTEEALLAADTIRKHHAEAVHVEFTKIHFR